MVGKRWTSGALALLLSMMSGCFSCSTSVDSSSSGHTNDDGMFGTPLFNGLTCETTDSSWQCRANDGTSLNFAIYFFTFRGIAVSSPPEASPSPAVFSWVQPSPTRLDITTDDGDVLVANDISGSVAKGSLSFTLAGGGDPTRSYSCKLDTENILDRNCDEKVDRLPTSVPSPTATATPTATPTSS
jgi:hypothetical protein